MSRAVDRPRLPLVIGLTGGIASGKSAAAAGFAARGVPVIDADVAARTVTAPGSAGLAAMIALAGPEIVQRDGTLDRAALRRRIFADPDLRARVEAELHPRILAELESRAAVATGPYRVLVIPLLLETGGQDRVDRVLVIDCPPAMQRQRLMARDGGTAEEAERVLAAQLQRDARTAAADDLILNAFDLGALDDAVAELNAFYLRLAATGTRDARGRRLPRWAHR